MNVLKNIKINATVEQIWKPFLLRVLFTLIKCIEMYDSTLIFELKNGGYKVS